MDWRLHRIVDSHVVHHLFSDMPFYSAIKATPYVKKALGKYYKASQVKVLGSCFAGYWSEYFRLMAVRKWYRSRRRMACTGFSTRPPRTTKTGWSSRKHQALAADITMYPKCATVH